MSGQAYEPRDDARFRTWRAETIETRQDNLDAEDLVAMLPYRVALMRLSKRLGLTTTCAVLEWFL